MVNKQIGVEVLVVDLCETLFFEDTTVGLISFHLKRSDKFYWRKLALFFLAHHASPIHFVSKAFEWLTNRQFSKNLIIRLLTGVNVKDLDESAIKYADYLISNKKIPSVWATIARIDRQVTLVASASLEPIVKVIARHLNAYYVASELQVRDGAFTGRYRKDITGEKEHAILLKYGSGRLQRGLAVITDNLSDLRLITRAKYRFVVIHKERQLARWCQLSAEYIRVKS